MLGFRLAMVDRSKIGFTFELRNSNMVLGIDLGIFSMIVIIFFIKKSFERQKSENKRPQQIQD
jgi:hypothetical protein